MVLAKVDATEENKLCRSMMSRALPPSISSLIVFISLMLVQGPSKPLSFLDFQFLYHLRKKVYIIELICVKF